MTNPHQIRIAAVGDIHVGPDNAEAVASSLRDVRRDADLLLLAGDLTQHGSRGEAGLLATCLARLRVPVVAVLGNHDVHDGHGDDISAAVRSFGGSVLDGEHVVLTVNGDTLAVAGAPGFGFGFPGRACSDFGEPEMKAFAQRGKDEAGRLAAAIRRLPQRAIRVVLTHYSPVRQTLVGEPPEIHAFLGNYLLAEAIDEASPPIHVAVHGHAHRGSEYGATPGGVPVRNVAMPVTRQPYSLLTLSPDAQGRR